jgi:hypothetical protein
MRKFRWLYLLLMFPIFQIPAVCNTPGSHTVTLTWTAGAGDQTYNVYRGTAAGVCNGTPTPYATGITATTYTDTAVPAGSVFYNVSAVGPTGESACNGEVSVTVQAITTGTPGNLAAVLH